MAGKKSLKEEMLGLIAPFRVSRRATLYLAGALALLLVFLVQGNHTFFARHFAVYLLPGASPIEVEWWGMMYQFASASLLFLVLPALILRFVAGEKLRELGLGLGDWRFSFLVVVPLGLVLLALPGGFSAGTMPDFCTEYPMAKLAAATPYNFAVYQLAYGLLYYVAYEAFFRGFLQLGLRKHIGDLAAILVQTAVTTLLHIGKPTSEIWAALLAGFLFGAIVLRTRSIWPLVIVHWGLGCLTDFFCARASGLL